MAWISSSEEESSSSWNNKKKSSSSSSLLLGRKRVSRLLLVVVFTLICSLSLIYPCNGEEQQQQQQQHQEEQECDASDNDNGQVILNGELYRLKDHPSLFPKQQFYDNDDEDGDDKSRNYYHYYYVLREDKPVLYVPNFINATIATELKDFCLKDENRFVHSPVRKTARSDEEDNNDDNNNSNNSNVIERNEKIRTSESCALVPAVMYLSNPTYVDMMNSPDASYMVQQVKRQVDVSWYIASKASKLLNISPTTVEPLQLVRYTTPHSEYKVHHDHGGYVSTVYPKCVVLMFLFLETSSFSFPCIFYNVVFWEHDFEKFSILRFAFFLLLLLFLLCLDMYKVSK